MSDPEEDHLWSGLLVALMVVAAGILSLIALFINIG